MGFFSWMTCDTNESISNRYSVRGPLTAYVLIPKEFGGGCIKETNYEGYGVFGGRDIFALVANWNKPDSCTGNDEEDRYLGIDLYYHNENNPIKYGIKIASKPMTYEDAELSEDCPDQGYFYCDEQDEEDDYDDWEEEDDYDDWNDEDEDEDEDYEE